MEHRERKKIRRQEILDSRKINGKDQYLVKWLGYGDEENLWESTENFNLEAFRKIEEYWQKLPKPKAKANQTGR